MFVRITILVFFLLVTFAGHGQSKNFIDVPYLETTATADTLVIPDRIYFNIIVSEKDAKGDMTLETLQMKMQESLNNLGIDTKKDLELVDLVSNFKKYFLKGQDIVKTKQYSLVVRDATTAGKVIVALENLGISNVSLYKLEYSKKEELLIDLKASAIRKSKRNATTMADELNQKIGAAIFISDQSQQDGSEALQGRTAGAFRAAGYYSEGKYKDGDIQFEKMKFESSVLVRYKLN